MDNGAIDEINNIFYLLAVHNEAVELVGLSTETGNILHEVTLPVNDKYFQVPFTVRSVFVTSDEKVLVAMMNSTGSTESFVLLRVDVNSGNVISVPIKTDMQTPLSCGYNPGLDELYLYAFSRQVGKKYEWTCYDASTGEEKYQFFYDVDQGALSPMVWENSTGLIWGMSTNNGTGDWCIRSYDPKKRKLQDKLSCAQHYYLSNALRVTLDDKKRELFFHFYDTTHGYSFVCHYDIQSSQSLNCTQCEEPNGCPLGMTFWNE